MNLLEQQQLQDRLHWMETSLARLLNHLPGLAYRCVVQKDYEYKLVFVSKGCERLMGVGQEEVLHHPTNTIERLTFEEDLAMMRNTIHQAILARKSYEIFYRIRLASDEEKWVWDQGEGVFDDQGNCLFLEGIMMDVTAQKTTEQQLKKENRQLRSSVPKSGGLGHIIGKSKAMQSVYELILKAAKSDTNVILYGETGVGKDLVAKTIHDLSGVKGRYIPVNCAAIPEQLLESEFFGHIKGAFSGATANRPGYLAAADGGTLFLDEIAELPLNLQVKLLRALESRTYTPVGSNEVKKSNFRLISATNRDLKAMVRNRKMRPDFFYRIHVLTIVLPPLRERMGDIPLLVASYAKGKGEVNPLPASVLTALEAYYWPGNVRELQNTLERYWAFGELELETESTSPDLFAFEERRSPADAFFYERDEHRDRSARRGVNPLGQEREEHGYAYHGAQRESGVDSEYPPQREAYFGQLDAPQNAHAGFHGGYPQHAEYARNSTARGKYENEAGSLHAVTGDGQPAHLLALADVKNGTEKNTILQMLEKNNWKKGKTADALGITMRTLQRKLKKYDITK